MNKYNLKTFDRRILNFNITYPVTKSRMKVATIPPPTQFPQQISPSSLMVAFVYPFAKLVAMISRK